MSWSPSNITGRCLLAAASLLITTLTITSSFAQSTIQQRNVCFGREQAAAGAQLAACTAIIDAARDQPSIISQAHTARGNIARAKDELDQAIDDFSLAIQLDGKNATLYGRGSARCKATSNRLSDYNRPSKRPKDALLSSRASWLTRYRPHHADLNAFGSTARCELF